MIWIFGVIAFVAILCGLAIYFEKKSGMTPVDENVQLEKLGETIKNNTVNSFGHNP
ncbi:hypothetical protein [Bacillus sp. B1-b2]|uniref:hypothetical protein n=1 Tax=Bacillus sp. B1-b2 TaxID=2653201 RepID=UPI001869FAE0|nr:hypothetical protein [Bacillus sp. B1-b2]